MAQAESSPMFQTYSVKIADLYIAGSGYVFGPLVPDGKIWIIRAITLSAAAGGDLIVQNYLTANLEWFFHAADPTNDWDIDTRHILVAGDALALSQTGGGGASLYASGYQFPAPA